MRTEVRSSRRRFAALGWRTAALKVEGERCNLVNLVYSVDMVCLVYLVDLVYLVCLVCLVDTAWARELPFVTQIYPSVFR